MSAAVRAGCGGVLPLDGRLEPWMAELCAQPARLAKLLERHGSPVNVHELSALERNAGELRAAAAARGLELGIHVARKANKCLSVVERATALGLGVDLASETELRQVLALGAPPERLVMTAAVKPRALLELCAASGTTVVLDNADELELLLDVVAAGSGRAPTPVALRLAPAAGDTRFGSRAGELLELAGLIADGGGARLRGLHFHLDGYRASDRAVAAQEALELIDELGRRAHELSFLDIGGGIPMSYLDDAGQWDAFWSAHRAALLGEREPLTYRAHGLGLLAHGGEMLGEPALYPYCQQPVRGDWLSGLLDTPVRVGDVTAPLAEALRVRGLELRCEPGRSLLDGCGLTAACVEFRKPAADGSLLVGLAMNRTQCRSTSDDFLVDPLLLAGPERGAPTAPAEGYLVGAYCIERELLSWRRLRFPAGVAVGDVVVFPNTAGYLMHILESASHQIPLARNLVVDGSGEFVLDPIDA